MESLAFTRNPLSLGLSGVIGPAGRRRFRSNGSRGHVLKIGIVQQEARRGRNGASVGLPGELF